MTEFKFLSCGDSAVTIELSKEIHPDINRRIRYLYEKLSGIRGVSETVPAFCSITVYYDPFTLSQGTLKRKVTHILSHYKESKGEIKRVFRIPVCYEGDLAPDMEDVCTITGLDREQVIQLHTSVDYLIYMLGFLPGFPYLGGMDERLEAPRLETPRTLIPPGAVGIGGKQTGIYPLASPGGWRLIGRTPVKVYDAFREVPIPYSAGDYIRFYPISREEFDLHDGSIEEAEEII